MKGKTNYTVVLQLVGRSIVCLKDKIEDVLVKMNEFIFSTNFIILGYEFDQEVPIILRRPFLSTSQTLSDVHQGELTM